MQTSPRPVSVVTIVKDRADRLAHLCWGLAGCDPPAGELVVIDMGSADPDAHRAAARLESGRWGPTQICHLDVRAEAGGGLPLAGARNLGVRAASNDRVVLLDVDCIPAPDLIGAYDAAISRGGLCNGPVRYLRAGWDEPTAATEVGDLWARSDPHPVRPFDHAGEIVDDRHELCWSLSIGLDRATFQRVGGFDDAYRGYGAEDTDFGMRCRAAGVAMRWMSVGTAFHQWHASPSPPVHHLEAIVANARRFHERWGRWPMEGWLADFVDRGLVTWSAEALALVEPAPPPGEAPGS